MYYDYIIIGGGISGLYAGLLLDKMNKGTILIVEKSDRLGGRINTIKSEIGNDYNDYNDYIEMGAGIISSDHQNLINLLKYLKLYNNLSEGWHITKYYIKDNIKTMILLDDNSDFNKIMKKLIDIKNSNGSNKLILQIMKAYTLYKFIETYLSSTDAEIIRKCYGYDSDILYQNALKAIELIEEHIESKAKYHKLKGGLSQIIDAIKNKLSTNVTIMTNSECSEITKNEKNIYSCILQKKMDKEILSKNIIFAVPYMDLYKIKMFENISTKYSNKIINKPLMRIYMYFPKIDKCWFDDLTGVYVSDSLVRQIIPINKESGLIMISYSDGFSAINMNNLEKEGILENEVLKCIRSIFNDRVIPEPIKTYSKYWDTGTHIWLQYISDPGDKELLNLMKPLDNENVYYIGEATSTTHNWIEGAIKSVNMFIYNFI